jgi:hypothetical protein
MNFINSVGWNAGPRLLALGLSAPTAACILSMLLCRANGRASAATRHLVWLLAFVMMAVSAPVALFGVRLGVPILHFPVAGSVSSGSAAPFSDEPAATMTGGPAIETLAVRPLQGSVISIKPAPSYTSHTLNRVRWKMLILSLWLIGFLVLSFKSIAGTFRVWRIIHRSQRADEPSTGRAAMKPLLLLAAISGLLPADAKEPEPFAPAPFQLEPSLTERAAHRGASTLWFGGDLLFSIGAFPFEAGASRGAIRIDYGIPIPSGWGLPWARPVDAPGSGYRKQRAKCVREGTAA